MDFKEIIKAAKVGCIIFSVLLCVLGIILIAAPNFVSGFIGVVMGILLIIFGIIRLMGAFSIYRLAFRNDIPMGIILIILGVLSLIKPTGVLHFICIGLGVVILVDGLFKIQTAFEGKVIGIKNWWLILVFAVLTAVAGLILIANPADGTEVLFLLLGITLIADGLLNIITMITAAIKYKNTPPTVDYEEITVEYKEENQ